MKSHKTRPVLDCARRCAGRGCRVRRNLGDRYAGSSGTTDDAGAGTDDGGAVCDPAPCATDGGTDPGFDTPTVCTSGTMWTRGDRGSASMHPGGACITCHD